MNEPVASTELEHIPEVQEGETLHPFSVLGGALFALCICVLCVCLTGLYLNTPPRAFPIDTAVQIDPGLTVEEIATVLAEAQVVRSASLFKLLTVTSGASSELKAGSYRFGEPQSTLDVVRALARGKHELVQVVVTIPEGSRISDIDRIAASALTQVEPGDMLKIAEGQEGYFFPETYHLAEETTALELVQLMQTMHAERMAKIATSSKHSMADVVSMASILEREGKSSESMHLISGILWKRLEIGMPLQVDATLEYERGLGSAELSLDDLRADSPYNTYTRKGLPPTPISNPGTVALTAAYNPVESPYLFYLTGNDGVFYYAKTFEEHKRNKERHLR
jgi:UPF0755 protein